MKKQITIIVTIVLLVFTASCASLQYYEQVQEDSFSGLFTRVNKYIISESYYDYENFTDSNTVIELKNNTEKKLGVFRNSEFKIILPRELVKISVDDEVILIGCSGTYTVYKFNSSRTVFWGEKEASRERFGSRYLLIEVQSINISETSLYFDFDDCHLDKMGNLVSQESYANYLSKMNNYRSYPHEKSSILTVNLWQYRDELQGWLKELGSTVVFDRTIDVSDMQYKYEDEKNLIIEYYGIAKDDMQYLSGATFKFQYIRGEDGNWRVILIDNKKEATQEVLQGTVEKRKYDEKVAEEERILKNKKDAYNAVIASVKDVLSNAFEEYSKDLNGLCYKISDDGDVDRITTSNIKELKDSDSIAFLRPLYSTDNPYNYEEGAFYFDKMNNKVNQWLSKTSFLGETYENVDAEDFVTALILGMSGFNVSSELGKSISGYFTIDEKQNALKSPFYMYKGVYEYKATSGAYKIVPHFQKIPNDEDGRKIISDYSKKQLNTKNAPTGKDLLELVMKDKEETSFDFSYTVDDWKSLATDDDLSGINFPIVIHCADGDYWYNR